MAEQKKRIIDSRNKEKYFIDDLYLDQYAELCGWQGTIVYNSLARHSNKNQKCFPSITLMSKKHGVSRNTIMKGVDMLEKHNIIKVNRSKQGEKNINNTYELLDKMQWSVIVSSSPDELLEKDQQFTTRTTPSSPDELPPVHVVNSKEPHNKEPHNKEPHNKEPHTADTKDVGIRKEITLEDGSIKSMTEEQVVSEIIYRFRHIDKLNYKKWYKVEAQKKPIRELLETYGFEEVDKVIRFCANINENGDRYAPQVLTPTQLRNKYQSVINYAKKKFVEKTQAKQTFSSKVYKV